MHTSKNLSTTAARSCSVRTQQFNWPEICLAISSYLAGSMYNCDSQLTNSHRKYCITLVCSTETVCGAVVAGAAVAVVVAAAVAKHRYKLRRVQAPLERRARRRGRRARGRGRGRGRGRRLHVAQSGKIPTKIGRCRRRRRRRRAPVVHLRLRPSAVAEKIEEAAAAVAAGSRNGPVDRSRLARSPPRPQPPPLRPPPPQPQPLPPARCKSDPTKRTRCTRALLTDGFHVAAKATMRYSIHPFFYFSSSF
ncbi:hypothetical protein T10_7859 [Trichinella papuae]|uniref:Uncharacterized protein n=1 Tax=Trichinella papuae TaxID=268474 RepID=A0A0V1MXX2_9BILA|nr:hypothetical protein T10_7859 [Trichinella papuae]